MENNDTKKFKATQSKRLLFLKKIKLKGYPEFSKNLNQYLWNIDKYFQNSYKDHYIIVGNKENIKTKTPLGNKRKAEKRKTRKLLNLSIKSNDKEKFYLNESKTNISRFDKKRALSKNIKENYLKIGQKYINDYEIEDLFNAYKTAQKLNKKKSRNFVFPKDYVDKNSPIFSAKTITNFNRYLFDKKNSINNIEYKNNSDNESVGGINSVKIMKKISNKKNNIQNKNNECYKTNSTTISYNNLKDNINNNNLIESYSKKVNFCSISKMNLTNTNSNNTINIQNLNINSINKKSKTANNFYPLNCVDEKNIISRNRLINRQNQFLLSQKDEGNFTPNKSSRNHYAQILAIQEQTLSKTARDELKKNSLYNMLRQKTHKSKENLLMTNIDSYRIKNELKDKFIKLNSKLEPEHIYNWEKDLREESKIKTIDNNKNINYYNIRDPFNKTIHILLKNKFIGKKNNMKYYKILIDETNNINNNYEGLCIKGKNLLKTEYEQIKLLKNKKIINNYDLYLPLADVEDILFMDKKYSNINKIKKNHKNKK